jgi:hypothetical protein
MRRALRFAALVLPLALHAGLGAPRAEAVDGMCAERWRADLGFLVQCIRDIHPRPYWQIGQAEFDSAVTALDRQLPSLDDHEAVVGLMRIVALLRDGHSGVDPGAPAFGANRFYPVRMHPFQDGVFIMSAAREHGKFVGARVARVGNATVQEAFARADGIANGENEQTRRHRVPLLLMRPPIVRALGITDTEDRLRFEVETAQGERRSFETRAVEAIDEPRAWYSAGEGVPVEAFVTARGGSAGGARLCWRDRAKNYWFEYLPEHRLLWMQFNSVLNAEGESLEAFCARLFEHADTHDVDKMVIDLRWNGGGNLELLDPLIRGLIRREGSLNAPGHLFAVIGRGTYSAAHVCAALLEAHTHVIFVGEPSGATPNHFGDQVRFELPHSKIPVRISKWAWQVRLPWDLRHWIAPQLPAPLTFADYSAGRDPAFDAILACDRYEPSVSGLVRGTIENEGVEAGLAAYRQWKSSHPDRFGWTTEVEMNSLGYRYLQDQEIEKAVAVLRANLETYPGSAQAFEILGEAYQLQGDRAQAAEHYQRALSIDPRQRAAAVMLRRLEIGEPPSNWR